MLSPIQLPAGGLDAPVGPSGEENIGTDANSDPFDQVMNRALAPKSKHSEPHSSTAHTETKPARQKSDPSSSTPRTGGKTSSCAPARAANGATDEAGPLTTDTGSRGKARSRSLERRSDELAALEVMPSAIAASALFPELQENTLKPKAPGGGSNAAPSTLPATGTGAEPVLPPASVKSCEGKESAAKVAATRDTSIAAAQALKPLSSENEARRVIPQDAAGQTDAPRQEPDSGQATSPDYVAADSVRDQVPPPGGPTPPQATALEVSPGKLSPELDNGVQMKPHSQLAPNLASAGTGKEFPQSLGTSVAQQESPMKKAQKVQKTAEPSQQNLPSEGAITARQTKPAASQAFSGGSPSDLEKVTLVSGNGPAISSAPAGTAISNPANAAMPNDARLTALERTHDLAAMHAVRLTQSGNDSLRVVLEPGGGTRLSLDLRFSNGGIQAQALLHRGDFQFLNNHWTELQQRLEPRGIHLGALKCSDQTTGGQERFQQSGRQSPQEQPTRSAFAEFALDGTMADSPSPRRTQTKSHAGWETWA